MKTLAIIWILLVTPSLSIAVKAMKTITKHILVSIKQESSLENYLLTDEFKGLVKDKKDAIQLYDHLSNRFEHVVGMDLPIMHHLKLLAFNQEFPNHFSNEVEILEYGEKRKEIKDLLIRSKAFNEYSSNDDELEGLVAELYKLPKLDPVMRREWIQFRVDNYWSIKVNKERNILKDAGFLTFLRDDDRALGLYLRLHAQDPKPRLEIMQVVADAAVAGFKKVKNDIDAVEWLNVYRDSHLLDFLQSSSHYQAFIQDPFRAHNLWTATYQSLAPAVEEINFFDKLNIAQGRKYKTFQDVLQTLKNIDSEDQQSFELLTTFGPFEHFIQHPYNAKILLDFVKNDPAIPKDEYLLEYLESFVTESYRNAGSHLINYDHVVKKIHLYDDVYLPFTRQEMTKWSEMIKATNTANNIKRSMPKTLDSWTKLHPRGQYADSYIHYLAAYVRAAKLDEHHRVSWQIDYEARDALRQLIDFQNHENWFNRADHWAMPPIFKSRFEADVKSMIDI